MRDEQSLMMLICIYWFFQPLITVLLSLKWYSVFSNVVKGVAIGRIKVNTVNSFIILCTENSVIQYLIILWNLFYGEGPSELSW